MGIGIASSVGVSELFRRWKTLLQGGEMQGSSGRKGTVQWEIATGAVAVAHDDA